MKVSRTARFETWSCILALLQAIACSNGKVDDANSSNGGASGSTAEDGGQGGDQGGGGSGNEAGSSQNTGGVTIESGTTSGGASTDGGTSNSGGATTDGGSSAAGGATGSTCASTRLCTASEPAEKDTDCDGIADAIEIGPNTSQPLDTDGDGTPDYRDRDSDDDGIFDNREVGDSCAKPLDSDADGTPDFLDLDSDDDTIADRDEGDEDRNADGIPNYLDLDSDGDKIPDRIEAGDSDVNTPPVDSDGDGIPNATELDSDDDGLADRDEDKNGNGVLDAGETDVEKQDTDGDTVSDMAETVAGTDPRDPLDNPSARGDFVFIEPYRKAQSPDKLTLDFATNIQQADVFLLVDTTGSMGTTITGLQSSLTNTIIPALQAQIPSVAIGIGDYRDFPTGAYGSSTDWPFKLVHRVMSVNTTAGIASLQTAVGTLKAGGGADGPESSWEALHQIATGAGTTQGGAKVPAFSPTTAYPTTPITGETFGTRPGVGFRDGSLPIIVYFTDAVGHNSDTITTGNYASTLISPRSTDVISELNAISARVIGVNANSGNPRIDQLSAVNGTGAIVPPTAWGTGASRPTSCADGQCCTGSGGVGEATNAAGNCPLSFLMASTGSNVGNAVVTAITVLASDVLMDISAKVTDDPSDSVRANASKMEQNRSLTTNS